MEVVELKVLIEAFLRQCGRWKGVFQVKRVMGTEAWERRVSVRVGGSGEE